jgi:mono/diheme cytochrome c family protein
MTTSAAQRETTKREGRAIALALGLLAAPLAPLAGGCSGGKTDPKAGAGDQQSGKALYAQLCASCHGKMGEGALAPAVTPWKQSEADLVDAIDGKMPQNDPAACDRTCAEDLAAYLVGLSSSDCATAAVPSRLRLLNRREYNATVTDLFFPSQSPPAAGASCQSDADCALESESCVGGSCLADPCNLRTFVLPAGGQQLGAVSVAGAFNGWSATAGADWQMTYVPAKDAFVLKHSLANGSYPYKFVVDGSWITDPGNPQTQDDGFGGKNSLLVVACSGGTSGGGTAAPAGFDPARDFPVETRPPGYPFDNSAEAGLVTSVHVDQYLKAAAALADLAAQNLGSLLPCDPAAGAPACAAQFVTAFGARAFRRPLTPDEVSKYQALVTGQADFPTGVKVAIQVFLSSPYFLYRFEIGAAQPDGSRQLTPFETATALSYGFWGTMPDQALTDAAAHGELDTAAGIEKQARRLLADPRSRPVVETFSLQWLGVESILVAQKSSALYPGFDDATRQALAEETRRFVGHVVFDGSRKYEELLTADYTFANDAVAGVYGIAGAGATFAQVSLPPARQAGLLGHGSVLGAYAYADQSSPVRRGLFVRRNLLCEDFPKPPPTAGKVPAVDPSATTRDRFSQHSKDPACASCHQYIDAVGFGFEHFDAIGQYRDTESGKPIDASGDMNDVEQLGSGTHAPFDGLPALAGILAGSEQSKACFTRQVYRFARGAVEAPEDRCAVDALAARFAASGFDMQELMIAVTTAPTFTARQ